MPLYVILHRLCLAFVQLSQMWALYCLVTLYEATREDLASINPLSKFLCVKGVVFFTFWQQCLLSALAYFGVFTLNHRCDAIAIATPRRPRSSTSEASEAAAARPRRSGRL